MSEVLPPVDLQYIRDRSTDGEGGCWCWKGHMKGGIRPMTYLRVRDAEGNKVDTRYSVRSLVYWIVRGSLPRIGKYRALTATCGEPSCVNPDHIAIVDRSYVARTAYETGRNPVTPERKKKVSDARKKGSKLSDADVANIRASLQSAQEEARKYGVSDKYIYMLRANEWRKDHANPFAALM